MLISVLKGALSMYICNKYNFPLKCDLIENEQDYELNYECRKVKKSCSNKVGKFHLMFVEFLLLLTKLQYFKSLFTIDENQ